MILTLLLLLAQPITDLGVMSPNRVVILQPCTNRADFVHFIVELQATRWPSNYAKFTTTNSVLRMDDFLAMPPGPCVIGLRSVCADSEESPISLFKVDIRRDAPKAPRAHMVTTGNYQSPQTLSNAMNSIRTNALVIPPLPNGKPETYSDSVLKMQRFYAEHQGRRNE